MWKQPAFKTAAQWDIDSLEDSAKRDPFRVVLHKLRLHLNLEERIANARGVTLNQFSIRKFKDDMMRSIY